jgi:hypothetical protein
MIALGLLGVHAKKKRRRGLYQKKSAPSFFGAVGAFDDLLESSNNDKNNEKNKSYDSALPQHIAHTPPSNKTHNPISTWLSALSPAAPATPSSATPSGRRTT